MEATQIVLEAKEAVRTFAHWLAEKVAPLANGDFSIEFARWHEELALIRNLVEQNERVRIALVGTTGAGKSTFLNAVLGQEVLPVGVMEPCTAFVTAISHSTEPGYRVTIQFCTPHEWQSDLESFIATLRPGEPSEEGGDRSESKRLMDAARKRIQSVYGDSFGNGTDPTEVLNRPLLSEAERIFAAGSLEHKNFDNVKEMLSYLRSLVRGSSSLWPLVKQVNVSGPYICLAGGLELIDLPGLNDPNEARVEVTREFLRTSPFVWVVFSMVRGLTEDVQRILREEKLLRTLVLSGTYHALSLVGTRADDIDTNIAHQLGLPEECSITELVAAYCKQTVNGARTQLEQMVRDLPASFSEEETLARMIEMARHIQVHTTSAIAYMKLKGIARLRKDYGLDDEEETGIPGVHRHLSEIAREAGAAYNAEMALKRLDQLREEIAFFFRAKAQTSSPDVEKVRVRLQHEHATLHTDIRNIQGNATDRLTLHREQFLKKVDPLFTTSVQGVRRATEGWRMIHWATLRAIVQRDGAFKSPANGRSYDLNEDLAEPFLKQLPVSWEQYFTDDLGHVTDEFVLRITESGKAFCGRVRLIIELIFQRKDEYVEEQLTWFQNKVSLLAQNAKNRILTAVRERRSELAAKIPLVAGNRMRPSYNASKNESGSGMKKRILDRLESAAAEAARPIYTTIRTDLLEGLNELEVIIVGMFRELAQAAEEQARIVAHNANIEVNEVATDPVIADLLNSIPT